MTLDEAIEILEEQIAKKCNLQEGWRVYIYLWEPSQHVGIRVSEVSLAAYNKGCSWMQSDVPDGLAVCAQVERCLLALVGDFEDDEISYDLTLLGELLSKE